MSTYTETYTLKKRHAIDRQKVLSSFEMLWRIQIRIKTSSIVLYFSYFWNLHTNSCAKHSIVDRYKYAFFARSPYSFHEHSILTVYLN